MPSTFLNRTREGAGKRKEGGGKKYVSKKKMPKPIEDPQRVRRTRGGYKKGGPLGVSGGGGRNRIWPVIPGARKKKKTPSRKRGTGPAGISIGKKKKGVGFIRNVGKRGNAGARGGKEKKGLDPGRKKNWGGERMVTWGRNGTEEKGSPQDQVKKKEGWHFDPTGEEGEQKMTTGKNWEGPSL